MKLDWILSFGLFMIFVAWSFSYYSSFFNEQQDPVGQQADIIRDSVRDYLMVEYYEASIYYNGLLPVKNQTFQANLFYPGISKNSTKVYLWNGTVVPVCNFTTSNDVLTWRYSLSLGANRFKIRFRNESVALRCRNIGSVPLGAVTTQPWTITRMLGMSVAKINQTLAMTKKDFMGNLSIEREFRIYFNVSGTESIYGFVPPNTTNIYVREIWDGAGYDATNINIRLLVW